MCEQFLEICAILKQQCTLDNVLFSLFTLLAKMQHSWLLWQFVLASQTCGWAPTCKGSDCKQVTCSGASTCKYKPVAIATSKRTVKRTAKLPVYSLDASIALAARILYEQGQSHTLSSQISCSEADASGEFRMRTPPYDIGYVARHRAEN